MQHPAYSFAVRVYECFHIFLNEILYNFVLLFEFFFFFNYSFCITTIHLTCSCSFMFQTCITWPRKIRFLLFCSTYNFENIFTLLGDIFKTAIIKTFMYLKNKKVKSIDNKGLGYKDIYIYIYTVKFLILKIFFFF